MSHLPCRRIASAIAIVAGLAASAAASDCRLSLSASDHILMPGETAQIHVWAEFPATAYAFAAADFDVAAEIPGWSFASAGAIAGDSVLGAQASQSHEPHIGKPADPANPKRIWTGTFAPASYTPRLVTIKAVPTYFEIFPSELTSSSAPCPADPGATRLLINPMTISTVGFAPAEGTPMQARWHSGHSGGAHFLFGDGSVRSVGGGVVVGLLLPAVQQVREAAARMETRGQPTLTDISISIQVDRSDVVPTEELSLNFEEVKLDYRPSIQWPSATKYTSRLFRGERMVGEYSSDGALPYIIGSLPNVHKTRIGDEPNLTVHLTWLFDEPTAAGLPGTPGDLVDRIEVVAASSRNNLKQLGIGLHSYHAESDTGPLDLSVIVDVPCRVDLNGDGSVDFFDFLAFQDLFAAGDAFADFSGDGVIDFFDFLSFQDEFARGCK